MAPAPPERSRVLTELGMYALSAVLSWMMLSRLLKQLDPTNTKASKQAALTKKELAVRLGKPKLDTNQFEDLIACDVINPEHLHVTFASIGGLDDIKQSLHDLVILPLVRPELFERGRLLKPSKGVLLYGPPGTGKTMLAKALAKESNACFINVRAAALQSKWFGDAQKLVTAVFTLAWKIQPCIIFIDEVDSFLGTRKAGEHEAVTSMKTEFMQLWDGFITDNDARVLVLAATNRPWDIDEAILRRLPRAFEVPLPDAKQRARILRVLLAGEDVDESIWADTDADAGGRGALEALATAADGYSGSDLQDLCKQAALVPIRELLDEERAAAVAGSRPPRSSPRPLSADDLFDVLERAPPPSAEAAAQYQQQRSGRGASAGYSSASASAASSSAIDLGALLAAIMTGASMGGRASSPAPGFGAPRPPPPPRRRAPPPPAANGDSGDGAAWQSESLD